MKVTRNHLRRLSEEELLDLCDAIDGELVRRQERRLPQHVIESAGKNDPSRRRRLGAQFERQAA